MMLILGMVEEDTIYPKIHMLDQKEARKKGRKEAQKGGKALRDRSGNRVPKGAWEGICQRIRERGFAKEFTRGRSPKGS